MCRCTRMKPLIIWYILPRPGHTGLCRLLPDRDDADAVGEIVRTFERQRQFGGIELARERTIAGATRNRSLSGKFNSSKLTLSLKGTDNLANRIRVIAIRQ